MTMAFPALREEKEGGVSYQRLFHAAGIQLLAQVVDDAGAEGDDDIAHPQHQFIEPATVVTGKQAQSQNQHQQTHLLVQVVHRQLLFSL